MIDPVIIKIQNHPKYKELRDKRHSFGVFLTILITGIYVRRANSEYDALTAEILKDATQ